MPLEFKKLELPYDEKEQSKLKFNQRIEIKPIKIQTGEKNNVNFKPVKLYSKNS